MTFEIEKGVPIPPPGQARKRKTKYPWAKMQPGDSFLVPVDHGQTVRAISDRLRPAARQRGRMHGEEYRVREELEGVRVWLVSRASTMDVKAKEDE